MSVEFKPWPKIYRENSNIIISEKIDGSTGCIIINDWYDTVSNKDRLEVVGVQSRKRLITPLDDNYGFAAWVYDNQNELLKLGPGYHYGEWAGPGINKNRHKLNEKRFFMFNTLRWGDHNPNTPDVCDVVPVLYEGEGEPGIIQDVMNDLLLVRSQQGINPEGVVVFNKSTQLMTKYTYEAPKGKWREYNI